MKAVILAGGKGTRLAPYTTVFPKPLVPIGDRPILDIIVRQLSHYGVKDIILSVGYLAELIQAYFQNATLPGVDIRFVKEKEPLGTAGSLGLIEGLDETFLVMNGDVLTSMDYAKLIAYHRKQGGVLTIGMHEKNVQIDLGVIETGDSGVLTDYVEKPEKNYMVSMGVYVYEPAGLKYVERGRRLDFPDLVLKMLDNGEKIVGYQCDDDWLDIGRQEDYAMAQELFERMRDRFLPFEYER